MPTWPCRSEYQWLWDAERMALLTAMLDAISICFSSDFQSAVRIAGATSSELETQLHFKCMEFSIGFCAPFANHGAVDPLVYFLKSWGFWQIPIAGFWLPTRPSQKSLMAGGFWAEDCRVGLLMNSKFLGELETYRNLFGQILETDQLFQVLLV